MPVVFRVNVPDETPGSGIVIRDPAGGTGKTPCAGPGGRIVNEKLWKWRSVAVYVPVNV